MGCGEQRTVIGSQSVSGGLIREGLLSLPPPFLSGRGACETRVAFCGKPEVGTF